MNYTKNELIEEMKEKLEETFNYCSDVEELEKAKKEFLEGVLTFEEFEVAIEEFESIDIYDVLDYNGRVFEDIDSCIPIYNCDLFRYAAEVPDFREVDDTGLLDVDCIDVIKVIQAAIYEVLSQESYGVLEEIKSGYIEKLNKVLEGKGA